MTLFKQKQNIESKRLFDSIIHTDLLVIGGGGAGLMSALQGSLHKLNVTLISKVPVLQSHTLAAKGGINAALGHVTEDNWRWHVYDTLKGGDWLGDHDTIVSLCSHAPQIIYQLEQWGMPFSRDEKGRLAQRLYGGQSTHFGLGPMAYRACYAADRTGHALLHTLYGQLLGKPIQLIQPAYAVELLYDKSGAHVHGAMVWQMDTGTIHLIQAKATILATGGAGQLYAPTTTANICTGDGNGLILNAKLPLQDMEFIQFHPTALYPSGVLISEAARAEGAILRNGEGDSFMAHYAPLYKELASRDVIARAMLSEIEQGRGGGHNKQHVWLDLTHLDPKHIAKSIPNVIEQCIKLQNIDPRHHWIPVMPAAHYTMGGIPTNSHGQVIGIQHHAPNDAIPITGLYAVGETACASVHGANRLGCNALLEIIVMPFLAINHLKQNINTIKKSQSASEFSPSDKALSALLCSSLSPISLFSDQQKSKISYQKINQLKCRLQKIMHQYVGVWRNKDGLEKAWLECKEMNTSIKNTIPDNHHREWNETLIAYWELYHLSQQALATILSAKQRTESRGAHYRSDFPIRNDELWLAHSLYHPENHSSSLRPIRTSPETAHDVFLPTTRRY
jgi:succinate dehydrogenase / fumarate reductase flavoprotein subunit